MEFAEVYSELQKLGTAQNVKVYKRHGAGDNLFGVSFADLKKLKKRIKTDHSLASKLWESGNSDARSLALMIADPKALTSSEAENMLNDIDYYIHADLFSELIAKSPLASKNMIKWMKSKKEYPRQCGYDVLSSRLKNGDNIMDEDCLKFLENIKKDIRTSPNRARHAMNNALIAIGVFKPKLADHALKAAHKIGKVEVDHGQTSCKTPDAVDYIKKSLARIKNKK